jgi:hypothetical protein
MRAVNKSPFLVFQNFISPLLCESIIETSNFTVPDLDKKGKPVKTVRRNEEAEDIIFERIQNIIPQIESHYGSKYKGTEKPILVEWFDQESVGVLGCENSSFLRSKWVRTKDREFTGILFLTDYQEDTPFDSDFEVYGGKLEFPQWNFGFNPQRGTLIIFPSGPHFINANASVHYGELHQVRFHISAQTPFMFDISNFPGDIDSWFKDIK